ncbi:signal peptidase I [Thermomonospora umbrina]|uniref:Signal peptidase I n=1 Tax=Thermomonospora umbrina TaxID=111806 RepID=A0A3D9SR29_9ACTN|nr:signal peptidase I [Thermomonospora umbrina]REE98402.1 signal peptidase I [Thermomonospora umbrina]
MSVDEAVGKKRRRRWRELLVLAGFALVLTMIVRTFVVQPFYIPSESMENTLRVGDRVLVNKFVYRTRDVQRGEVVVFHGEDSWDAGKRSGSNPLIGAARAVGGLFGIAPGKKEYVKRVVGAGGDWVRCCDAQGRITVNGVPVDERDYLFRDPITNEQDRPSDRPFEVLVPPGSLWVMGDHRSQSRDSRAHRDAPGGGVIPEKNVVGRAFVIIWPLDRAGNLPVPDPLQAPTLHAPSPTLGLAAALSLTFLGRGDRLSLPGRPPGRRRRARRGRIRR